MHYFSKDDREIFIDALNEFFCSLVNDLLKDTRRRHFIEDSTWNMSYIKSLSQVFPEAKFIHVYRDPRDVVSSFTKQRWMPDDIRKAVKIYKDLITDILDKTKSKKNCYSLKFEDLVENKDYELTRVCAFLGLEYSENMRGFKLESGNIGRYRKEFTEEEIRYLNYELAAQIEVLGYAK